MEAFLVKISLAAQNSVRFQYYKKHLSPNKLKIWNTRCFFLFVREVDLPTELVEFVLGFLKNTVGDVLPF